MDKQSNVIGFAPNLVPLIKKGTKTLTYRVGDKYGYLKVGDKILFKNSENNKVVGELEITETNWTTFKDLPIDRQGHEIYPSKQAQKDTFKKYYKQDIKDNEPILVLGFKLLALQKGN